jgi:hypothetical protein
MIPRFLMVLSVPINDKHWDSTIHGFWTLSIILYSKKKTMFQKLLSSSGVTVKRHITETAVLKQWVPILSPEHRNRARAQTALFQSEHQTMDKVHKPSNPKLIHHPENSSELQY